MKRAGAAGPRAGAAPIPARVRSPGPATGPGLLPEETLLEARGLEIVPPGSPTAVVSGFRLSVRPGEWVALTGRNGGGKSSVLMALAGLWPVASGSLRFAGEALGPGPARAAAGEIGVVLQDPSSQLLQPTVAEELAFTARNLGLAEGEITRSVRAWSAALGLEGELARDPAILSAGRQQLVLLAAALVAGPRLLLADEPTAHLDAATRSRVCRLLAAEVAAGLAVVWATQDPAELEIATRTVVVGEEPSSPSVPRRQTAERPRAVAVRLHVAPSVADQGPRVQVAAALEIEVATQGVTALLGANGAGKSVILAAAAGLSRPAQVRLAWTAPPARPPLMALQYPEQQVFEEEVAAEVVFAAVSRGLARTAALAAAEASLARLGLDPGRMLARRTWTLSTGEKRLVEVVGTLIAPASLVLLDEPTAGLDPRRRAALAGLVLARAEATPVLLASQDRGWVEGLPARCYRLGE